MYPKLFIPFPPFNKDKTCFIRKRKVMLLPKQGKKNDNRNIERKYIDYQNLTENKSLKLQIPRVNKNSIVISKINFDSSSSFCIPCSRRTVFGFQSLSKNRLSVDKGQIKIIREVKPHNSKSLSSLNGSILKYNSNKNQLLKEHVQSPYSVKNQIKRPILNLIRCSFGDEPGLNS